MIETLKDYLVKLGFQVDNAGYRKTQEIFEKLNSIVSQTSDSMAASYAKAAVTMAGAVTSIGTATVSLMGHLANADLSYQKYAMRMHMSIDTARQLKIVTDAMGESLEDIAWIPELRERYFRLMEQARKMETPGDSRERLRYLRDVRYEFSRLKVEGTYGLQWLGYNLFKYLVNPVTGAKFGLKDINDYIASHIPQWSDTVAKFLSRIVIGLLDAGKAVMDFAGWLKKLWDSMSEGQKAVTIFSGLAALFLATGPFGKAIAAMSTLILLINDYQTYLRGGKTFFKPEMWEHHIETLREVSWQWFLLGKRAEAAWDVIRGKKYAAQALNYTFTSAGIEEFKKQFLEKEQREALETKKTEAATPGAGVMPSHQEIFSAAQEASKRTGIPAPLIYGQWYHETGNFANRGARELHNLAGIRLPGSTEYRQFESLDDFVKYYSSLLIRRYPRALEAKSPEALAEALKAGRYYEDPNVKGYGSGIAKGASIFSKAVEGVSEVTRGLKEGPTGQPLPDYLKSVFPYGQTQPYAASGAGNTTVISPTFNISGVSDPHKAAGLVGDEMRTIIQGRFVDTRPR